MNPLDQGSGGNAHLHSDLEVSGHPSSASQMEINTNFFGQLFGSGYNNSNAYEGSEHPQSHPYPEFNSSSFQNQFTPQPSHGFPEPQEDSFSPWGFSARFSGLSLDEQPSHHRGYSLPSLRSDFPAYPSPREESEMNPYSSHTPLDSHMYFSDMWDSSAKSPMGGSGYPAEMHSPNKYGRPTLTQPAYDYPTPESQMRRGVPLDSPMSQLLTGGAPPVNSPSIRSEFGAPGTLPTANRGPIRANMPPSFPTSSMNHSSVQISHGLRPQQPTHHRTSSADSFISERFTQPYVTPGSPHSNISSAVLRSNVFVDSPIKPLNSVNSSTIPPCKFYANGFCSRGESCNFSHTLAPEPVLKLDDKEKRAAALNRLVPQPGPTPNLTRPPPMLTQPRRTVRPGPPGTTTIPSASPATVPSVMVPSVVPSPIAPPPGPQNPLDLSKKLVLDASRIPLEQIQNQVYRMCKDQHGCRFLQKKLEEKDKQPVVVDMIFNEVYDHMVELMTDPFGNYLCQKLIEHCDEQQQLLIVQKVAPHLVGISKNMHGTRAVQKMIECLCTPAQVQLVVNSLKSSVVTLIQDLNGNHVIQRCLNQLSNVDKQFVYDAVAENCVEVATHRHGCCVMQRCIDYASDEQQLQLVRKITQHVLTLVKDPFGNYVVQYVLDLPFSLVKIQLIQKFCGHLVTLSTQKFSSNVIEKCLHVADPSVQVQLIDELMQADTLPVLLQDPYGNYVIQTALTIASVEQRNRLIDEIRPLLPALRNTPYGKRIQNKITKDCTTTHQ